MYFKLFSLVHTNITVNRGIDWLVGWLCFASTRQRDHLETASPFTVPCEGRGARFLHRSHRESNPGPSRGSPLLYRCATPAPGNWGKTIVHSFDANIYYVNLGYYLHQCTNWCQICCWSEYVMKVHIFHLTVSSCDIPGFLLLDTILTLLDRINPAANYSCVTFWQLRHSKCVIFFKCTHFSSMADSFKQLASGDDIAALYVLGYTATL